MGVLQDITNTLLERKGTSAQNVRNTVRNAEIVITVALVKRDTGEIIVRAYVTQIAMETNVTKLMVIAQKVVKENIMGTPAQRNARMYVKHVKTEIRVLHAQQGDMVSHVSKTAV